MTMVRRSLLLLSVACVPAVVLLLGCSNPNDQNTAIVRGKITYNGNPVTKGNVTFYPDVMGPAAMGMINPDGTYSLSTYATGDGAVVGTHKVAVVSKEEQTNFEANAPPTDGKWLVPAKYFLEATSGLTAEVKAGQENEINFDLKDD
jgi:hypothetical protein